MESNPSGSDSEEDESSEQICGQVQNVLLLGVVLFGEKVNHPGKRQIFLKELEKELVISNMMRRSQTPV